MIANQILTTKLYTPLPRPYLVTRPRLVDQLQAGLQIGHQLTLISAPAGFGKTTLASEWLVERQQDASTAWISLDEGDNEATRFLFYLITALQQIDPQIGSDILPLLQSSQPILVNELVSQVINQIAEAGKKIFLILDDYHLITSEAVHQIMLLLIERHPKGLHIVILTREDPPFPLPRMRVRGQVTDIRERDLRFTLPEAQSFLKNAMGLALTPDDVAKLKDRTEGWVAGMQLAALALGEYTEETDRRAFIEAFAGSDRYIVDYLISEVLERQPQTIRAFLLETSILDRFCADLCDQVVSDGSGAASSQAILAELEQGNMFLVPLDNQRRWYRYHHLFQEMLAHALQQSAPERAAELHRKAYHWFETKGHIPEAVKHASAYAAACGDWEIPRSILDQHAMRALFNGQVTVVIGWCQAFPNMYLERAPEIYIYSAWALALTFRNDYLEVIEEKLRLAEHAIAATLLSEMAQVGQDGALVPLKEWVTGQACVIRSQILLGRFQTYIDPQELIALSLKGLELLPEVEKAVRAICKINLAHAQAMQSHLTEAQKAFEEVLPFMLEAHNYLGGVTAVFYQARLAYYLGQMDRAEALCRLWKGKFVEMAGPSARDIPAIRGLDIVLCLLQMERNQYDEAEKGFVEALELPGWASWMELIGFILLAQLRHLRGNEAGVEQALLRMASLGPQHASCAQALTHLFTVHDPQRRAQAAAWAQNNTPDLATQVISLGIGPYHSDAEYLCNLCWAQVQIALGNAPSALPYIDLALNSARENGITYRIIELLVIRAMALEAAHPVVNDHRAAIQSLTTALDLAEPFGYVRVFDKDPNLDRMLHALTEKGIHSAYIRRLLTAFHRPVMDENTSAAAHAAGSILPSDRGGEAKQVLSQPATPIEPASHIEPASPIEAAPLYEAKVRQVKTMLVEPLSERELEVLRLIAIGLSNQQIGERLYIAEGTVKRHITNLYGKLAVQSRTQAIAKARELGLIS